MADILSPRDVLSPVEPKEPVDTTVAASNDGQWIIVGLVLAVWALLSGETS